MIQENSLPWYQIVEMNSPDQIIKDLKNLLKGNFGDIIKDVILFGSQASGHSREDSDYDILIIIKIKPDWQLEKLISDTCYDIDLKYNIVTETHILAESELKTLRGKQPVFRNAILKGIYA